MNYQTFANSEDHTHMKQLHTFQNKQSTVSTRKNLYNLLNGNIFYHINQWPIDIQIAFNNTPISDTDTFKIILFWKWMPTPLHYRTLIHILRVSKKQNPKTILSNKMDMQSPTHL